MVMKPKMKVLDLFSGIGGFSLGLERTGGFETVAFCEIEKFPRKVLAKHWPDVKCYEDVRELNGKEITNEHGRIDVITGGFPCQDISVAGKQGGLNAERSGLWSEIVRLSSELRPSYIIVENVANLLSGPSEKRGGWFGRVLGDLACIGYDAEWENIPAAALGAVHRRERVYILAYPNNCRRERNIEKSILRKPNVSLKSIRGVARWAGRQDLPTPRLCCTDDGVPDRMGQLKAYGNTVMPQIPELIGMQILDFEND